MPTLTQCRRAILEEIGGGGVYTTDSAGSTTTLVCAAGFKNSSLPTDHLAYAWVHVPTTPAPKQQQVTATGLTSASGTITVGSAFGSSINSATAFEVSTRLALIDGGNKTAGISLNQCVNLALQHLLVPDELTVAITTSDEIALTTWQGWLDRVDRLRAVLEPSPVSGRAPIDASWRFRSDEPLLTLDAELPKLRLEVPFSTATGSLTLQVLRPAETWLRISSTWTEMTPGTGMTAETDETKVDLAHIRAAGKVFAYQAMAEARSGARRGEYQAQYEAALADARKLRYWDASRDKLQPPPAPAAMQQEAA